MNIEVTKNIQQTQQTLSTSTNSQQKEGETKFADELIDLSKEQKSEVSSEKIADNTENKDGQVNVSNNSETENEGQEVKNELKNMENMIAELNRIDEKSCENVQIKDFFDDKSSKREDLGLIDNNMNIQEPKEKIMPEMNTNMNFNSNGQPFSEFINPENTKGVLRATTKDIAEEKAVLSTMEENIAIANRNIAINEETKTKTVINDQGIKKVNKETNVTVDTVVSYDSVIMDKSDVEFFANLAEGNVLNLNDVKNPEKSSAVSKTLLDLLAKSMEDNRPVRIDFDNNISVIIKISRDGKISADFLPSSQVAEAYLKENLPLLKQRFDDNNIEYEELNQRKQNQNENNDNRKKGRKDE